MFYGEDSHTLDDKGRLTIPARHRTALASGVVITRGIDHCLTIYPRAKWEEISAAIDRLPMTDPNARSFRRHFFSSAVEDIPDKQGRVLIPQHLREYAGITSEVMVAGVRSCLELWNPSDWREFRQRIDSGEIDVSTWANLGV